MDRPLKIGNRFRVLQNNKALKPQIRLKSAYCRTVISFITLLYHVSSKFSTISHKSSVIMIARSTGNKLRFLELSNKRRLTFCNAQ